MTLQAKSAAGQIAEGTVVAPARYGAANRPIMAWDDVQHCYKALHLPADSPGPGQLTYLICI